MNSALKDVRAKCEEDVAALQRQVEVRKGELESELEHARAQFAPASSYVPLDVGTFNRACWALYRDLHALPANPRDTEELLKAVHEVGHIVKKRHQMDFIKVGNNAQQIQDYLSRKKEEQVLF